MPLDTEFVKAWCRIDGAEFDGVLPTMTASAIALASHETGKDYSTEVMPEPVKAWCAAQVAHWIANPEASTARTLSPSPFLNGLLDPYRSFAWTPAA